MVQRTGMLSRCGFTAATRNPALRIEGYSLLFGGSYDDIRHRHDFVSVIAISWLGSRGRCRF